jgi:hypothetical protein
MGLKNVILFFFQQLRTNWKSLLVLYLLIFMFLGALFSIALIKKSVDIPELVSDVTIAAHVPFYYGALSQIGMIFWAAAVTVCFLTLIFLAKVHALDPATKRFLLLATVFTFVLMIDDMFLFHDEIAEEYLGINEKLVMISYLILGVSFVYFNRSEILSSEYSILILALGLFAVSVFFDAIPEHWYRSTYALSKLEHIIEDGSKFAAIVTWFIYFSRYSFGKLETLLKQATLT